MGRKALGPRLGLNKRTGVYEARYTETLPDGTPRTRGESLKTTDPDEASRAFDKWLEDFQKAPVAGYYDTVGECIDAYAAEHLPRTKSAYSAIRSVTGAPRGFFGSMRLSAVTKSAVQDYRDQRAKDGLRPASVARELALTRAAVNWCAEQEPARIDPEARLPKFPGADKTAVRTEYLTHDQHERVLAVAEQIALSDLPFPYRRTAYFLCIALNQPPRPAAIEELEWSQIRLDRKGEPDMILYAKPGVDYGKKRRAPVRVGPRLKPILMDLMARRAPGSPYVLGHPGSTKTQVMDFIKRHNLPYFRRYDLRRTWATRKANDGKDLFAIAGALADNVATVMKHYAHHHPDYQNGLMD